MDENTRTARNRAHAIGAALGALLSCIATTGAGATPLTITRITPAGEDVPGGRQIVVQFDRAVVPVGRMARDAAEIPIAVTPATNCEWRWLNTSALACQLGSGAQLALATRYSVVVSPDITASDGAHLGSRRVHSFLTERPKVTYASFVNWLAPGSPLVRVAFNQPVTRESVTRALVFETGNNAIPLAAYPDDEQRRAPRWALPDAPASPEEPDDVLDPAPRRVWVVEPVAELPPDSTVSLEVKPGLVAAGGPERGVERRTVVAFDTYPAFRFLGLRCTPKGRTTSVDWFIDEPDARAARPHRCAPSKPVALLFSAPVLNSAIAQHVRFEPRLDGGREDFDPWQNVRDRSRLGAPHRQGRLYERWLPSRLGADRAYRVTIAGNALPDEFGRRLVQPVSFAFRTGHREPNLETGVANAVLEQGIDSDVPLYVTNLEHIDIEYDRLGAAGAGTGLRDRLTIDPATDIAYARPFEVRRLLDGGSGAVFARLHPHPEPPGWRRDRRILAQVTPWQVHYKLGHFNSLAWVTKFSDGAPVADAAVSLWTGSADRLTSLKPMHVSARTNRDGLARLPGLAEIDPELALVHGRDDIRLFAKVEHGGEMALLPVDWAYSVRGGGVYSWLRPRGAHARAWGTTAQGVYKLGDTIEYKIYVRDQSNRHWTRPDEGPYVLTVTDPQGKIVFERRDLLLNRFGAADGRFTVPASGAVGWYRFHLAPDPADGGEARFTWQPLSVLVSDFTPSPFRVSAELNGENFTAGDRLRVAALAHLHAGGPYAGADVRINARLEPRVFTSDNPFAAGFTFGGGRERRAADAARVLADVRRTLDDQGEFETTLDLPDSDIHFGAIVVEAAVRDDRGKFVAATATAAYAGRDHFVGLRTTRWLYRAGQPATLETLVVDRDGRTVENAPVAIVVNRREVRAARVKGPGNAYLTRNTMRWLAAASCQLITTATVSTCSFVPTRPGYYQFVATTLDGAGRDHHTTLYGWVTGKGTVVWDASNDATLPIVAEKAEHRIGETARFLVKNPFPGTRALVTVERYGVLDSWVTTLESNTPVIEVPIKADYVPGFYLSVVAVSPRVAAAPAPGKVDLGKPGFRLGYLAVTVSDPVKRLQIDVAAAAPVVKPRARVSATIRVGNRGGDAAPVEIAVAVVDEAVLALNRGGSAYYDPYRGFNHLDGLDVNNYSLLSRLVGRQKFEKKGANPGGGGGADTTSLRNRFRFVSYWNPSIEPDADGRARIDFTVPDNLTGWRILAFAVTPDDRMGLGETSFRVNRPTEIRPVMPNQLVAGDRVIAGFTVMNRTGGTREITVAVDASGPLAAGSAARTIRKLTVAPYARVPFTLPLETNGPGELRFVATAGDGSDSDAIEHSLIVRRRRPLETAATYGSTTTANTVEEFAIPDAIHTDVGGIEAVLSPSVIGNLDGTFDYLRNYPHRCWEQRLTKAVAASAYAELRDYVGDAATWPAPLDDVRRALESAASFQAPNGGMAYWQARNETVSPYLSAYTALAFNWLRRDGHVIPAAVEQSLHGYLRRLLRRDEFPSFYSTGMAASVRAVALAALAERGAVTADDVLRYERHVGDMDLFGKAHFLRAAHHVRDVPGRIAAATATKILAHANQSGGKFLFTETLDDGYAQVLASPLRSNCAVLSALVDYARDNDGDPPLAAIPFRLVRAITQGLDGRSHFSNTQENVFCLNALVNYAKRYENERPDLRVAVALDGNPLAGVSFDAFSDPAVTRGRALAATDPGKPVTMSIAKQGAGRLYYSARLSYSDLQLRRQRINAGIDVRREYSVERNGRFVALTEPARISRGELVRVDLFVSVPAARHFVVVDDPVPGGLEPVNGDFATASIIDAAKGQLELPAGSWFYSRDSWNGYGHYFSSFYHRELRFEAARFYADYLPPGDYHLSYTAQAIAAGEFFAMPVKAEEMYDPDVFGKSLPATLHVAD